MNIEKLLFDGLAPGTAPTRRALLLAEPLMKEPYFRRSVVLILEKDAAGGYIGLTLNKRAGLRLGDLFPGWTHGADIEVYSGGPVEEQRMFMLHTLGDVLSGSHEILPGIYVGGDLEDIGRYIKSGGDTEDKIRFFLGYSGWGADQLDKELLSRSWAVADVGSDREDVKRLLSGSENDYWRREVERLGDSCRSWLVVPETPWLN
ncbi:MAG: YqgE/AlgH family protein [Muribaculaceae bacterium]|nr:YqgE/AlgH family protein [Muribaculaceae bacterium]